MVLKQTVTVARRLHAVQAMKSAMIIPAKRSKCGSRPQGGRKLSPNESSRRVPMQHQKYQDRRRWGPDKLFVAAEDVGQSERVVELDRSNSSTGQTHRLRF